MRLARRVTRPALFNGWSSGVPSAAAALGCSCNPSGKPSEDGYNQVSIMTRYIGAVDQGTTSTRFIVFDHAGREVARHQLEHAQILPQAGWVEHDPLETSHRVCEQTEARLPQGNSPP